MNPRRLTAPIALTLVAVFVLFGVSRVPFHPDETSLLFQSRDLEQLLMDPLALTYAPGDEQDLAAKYRALNAPLPKYVLGLGRRAAGFGPEAVDTDWRWDLSWEENLTRGALPPPGALLGARLASTLMLITGFVLVYFVGLRIGGRQVGLVAAGLLGVNSLALVHGRRAMAEGTLIFAVGAALLAALDAKRRPWLAGLAAAAAVGAKHSAVPLAIVGLVASTGLPMDERDGLARRGMIYLASFTAGFLIINPFLWRAPIAGMVEVATARSGLLARQVEITQALAPHGSFDTFPERSAAFIGQVFILPPQLQEIGNYAQAVNPTIESYISQPHNTLLRGPILGSVMLILFVMGLVLAGIKIDRREAGLARRPLWTLGLATALQSILLFSNPLPVQRYYVPLLPLIVIWQAFALVELTNVIYQAAQGRRTEVDD